MPHKHLRKVLGYYRNAEESMTLAEAVTELWKERADAIRQLEQQTPLKEEHLSKASGNILPAD